MPTEIRRKLYNGNPLATKIRRKIHPYKYLGEIFDKVVFKVVGIFP